MIPKVLIFTPIYEAKDYCLEEFLSYSQKITYPNKRHIFIDNSTTEDYTNKLIGMGLEAYHVPRGNNSREALARAQNFARKIAIEGEYDYLFSLESDIMVNKDIVQALLSWGKDVISALYMIGDKSKGLQVPCITLPKWHEELGAFGTTLVPPEQLMNYINKGIKQVQAAGMGCCLIHKSVFKRFVFKYDPRFKGHSDIYFFNDLFEKRIPVWVDTDIICDHRNSKWQDVKDR
jgi:hypothetical protein